MMSIIKNIIIMIIILLSFMNYLHFNNHSDNVTPLDIEACPQVSSVHLYNMDVFMETQFAPHVSDPVLLGPSTNSAPACCVFPDLNQKQQLYSSNEWKNY